ncbi:recombinase family protein [Streptacidiphilus jiangxiensis]|uniref:Site-specific DNA recombinase n=1 Tax=Streptacidiphilus jiangxiensis TaxID=235985 RepID=A0A1H8B6V1_STRJI|nr:recombinase family protein [Streptacidiphilus jiangxiensis]SEM78582.1 Site-specific DNA recombinase [Streptacidiphilus jiangxiensis]
MAIYLRVSTVKQLKGYGLQVQLEECLAWLDYRLGQGMYVYEVFTDGGVSGKLAQRPELDALNNAVCEGRFDLVVFGKLDRIGRTMKDIHRWVYDTTDRGVRVATADGRIDSDDDMFGILLSLLAYMAELEHAMILDRTMGGREKKLSAGGWPGGVAPFWLQLPGKGSNDPPTLREEGIRLLEAAASLLVDERRHAEEAARRLNLLGYRTVRGLEWTGANLIRTFQQTGLDGYIVYRNTEHPRGASVRMGEDGLPLYGETVRIPVPTPLPADRVTAVRQALAQRSFVKPEERGYLLSGRLKAPCGHHYIGTHRSTRDRTTYRCSGHRAQPACGCQEILAEPLEAVVWGEMVKVLGDREKLRALAREWIGDVPERARTYRERIIELDAQLERHRTMRKTKLLALATAMAADGDDGSGTEVEIQQAITELKAELKDKEARLRRMREETVEWLAEAEAQEERAQEVLELALHTDERLADMPVENRQDLLDLLDVEVAVTSDVPGSLRRTGCPFETWFEDRDLLVPPALTEERWSSIAGLFPVLRVGPTVVPPRLAFEASLYKARTGLAWKDLPDAITEGRRPHSVYQRALMQMKSGAWEQAVRALGSYEGTPVPPTYALPDLHITASFDPRLSSLPRAASDGESSVTGEGAERSFSNCLWHTPAYFLVTTAASCGPCSALP